ncbi:hypothetical protein BGW80DRAFT_614949 [Lactifluus volemus]|nr:hypothetical protein BGW80DRAFT_614949 [Lactifluus volemus]
MGAYGMFRYSSKAARPLSYNMSASPPIPPDIARMTAPLLLGNLWNWALYGVLVVQIYVYSYNFPNDKKLLKLLVYAIFLLETLQTSLSGADLYYWFASGYGDLKHLATPYASSFDIPIIGAVVSLAVQFFFVYRIWVLGKKKCLWLCLIICLLHSPVAFIPLFIVGSRVVTY